jgi:hypothetical protein
MTTKIVSTLIIGALLAGSAAAALQATDATLAPAPVSGGCHSRTESATSGGSRVVVVVAPASRFVTSAGTFTRRTPRIVLLTPRPSSAPD